MSGDTGGCVWGTEHACVKVFCTLPCHFSKVTSCIQQLEKRLLPQQGFKGHLLWIASASVEHGWWQFKATGASSSPRHCQQAKMLRDDNPASSTDSELSLPIWLKPVRAVMNWFQWEHINCNPCKGHSGSEVWFWKNSRSVKGNGEACKPKPERNAGSRRRANSLGAGDDGCSIGMLTGSLAGERVPRDCCALLHLWPKAVVHLVMGFSSCKLEPPVLGQ